MIPVIEINSQGDIETLYTDEVDLYELGLVHNVRRASNVEFNQTEQVWEVISVSSNEIVYRHKNREQAIEWEIQNFGVGGVHYDDNGSC